MHKDKPPGLFDFAERSIRYLVGFWFTAGLILSLLVHTGILIRRADAQGGDYKRNPDLLEAEANARKPATTTVPPPVDAVKYELDLLDKSARLQRRPCDQRRLSISARFTPIALVSGLASA